MAQLTLVVSLGDLVPTRLLIWTLWQLVHEMRVGGPYTGEFAQRLEEALDRYVRTFATPESEDSQPEG